MRRRLTMAGLNPGMIIKVAADISEAVAALGNIVKGEAEVEASTNDDNKAYDALAVAVGTFAANAATALFGLAFDAVKGLGKEVWGVVDAALGLSQKWKDFTGAISDSIRESGALKAGFETLSTAVLNAFGGTREQAIRTIVDLIERGALKALDFAKFLVDLGVVGARAMAALIVPVDALFTAIGFVGEKLATFSLPLVDLASKVPGVGSTFDGLKAKGLEVQAAMAGWKEENYENLKSPQALVSGTGPYMGGGDKGKRGIDDTQRSILNQRAAADLAKGSIKELGDANAGLVKGTGEAAVALYNQNEQLAAMDKWSLAIKNTDPYAYLKQGMEKTLPPLAATTTALETAGTAMKDTGKKAIDMSADVKFAAEVVQKATLSWSEAMEAVRRGEGTMTGTIGKPTRPAGMSDSEWNLMQTDPRQWELLHGFDWNAPHAGTGAAWSMGGGGTAPASGTTVNQHVTVNTVAGDKQAIATVVKDALASEWRSSGVKG